MERSEPAPPAPGPVPLELDVLVAPLELVELAPPPPPVPPWSTHSPSAHCWPLGQSTPSQGQLPHWPVAGSQQEPSVQGADVH